MQQAVEGRFLYATLLSTDLLPFGHLDYRLLVLPLETQDLGYRVINSEEARVTGFLRLATWLVNAESEWHTRRGAKAASMSIYERLDRYRGLTAQNPLACTRAVYSASATNLTAAVIESEDIVFESSGQRILSKGYVADYTTYYTESEERSEAYYLIAVLNAPVVNRLIKPTQARGLWGPRHICKKVLELPIPLFDAGNAEHARLAELGEECTAKVKHWVQHDRPLKIKSIGKLRGLVREMLKDELREIDSHVVEILKGRGELP